MCNMPSHQSLDKDKTCRTNRKLVFAGSVGQIDFDQAILRAVAGVEKKRSILQGAEKESVAKHECGHALVSTAIASLIPTSSQVFLVPYA